jgi:hypothetical protein
VNTLGFFNNQIGLNVIGPNINTNTVPTPSPTPPGPLPTNLLYNLGTLVQTEPGLIPIYNGDGLGTTEPSTEIQQTVLGISIYSQLNVGGRATVDEVTTTTIPNLNQTIANIDAVLQNAFNVPSVIV